MDGRADVVDEPGQRELRGPRPAADRVRGLVDADGPPGARQLDRGGEPVRARPDDDRVERRAHGRRPAPDARPRPQLADPPAADPARGRRHRGRRPCAPRASGARCRRTSTAGAGPRRPSSSRRPAAPRPASAPGSRASAPRTVVRAVRAEDVRELDERVARALERLGLGDGLVAVAVGGERDPCGQRVALRRHERERLVVSVDHHHAGRHLHRRAGHRRRPRAARPRPARCPASGA